jgi:Zn-dependent peptidase ImmA (M78 family)/transcriptional regulator with XRE-family HTH domain
MNTALINPKIIEWARDRADVPVDNLPKDLRTKYASWESGEKKPTFKQAQDLAKALRIPFGFLYLEEPPAEQPLTPDLRTVDDLHRAEYSAGLKDVISDAIRKQDWYRDSLVENGYDSLEFVGCFDSNTPPKTIANSISETLALSLEARKGTTKDSVLRYLTDQAEEAGIWVMRSGKVGSNTRRILDVEEFRGFALSDPIAPLVFINAADVSAAQIFTLAHELAHLWIGENGVSNYYLGAVSKYPSAERLCNQVAAELLVPAEVLKETWKPSATLQDNADRLTRTFAVSNVVIARRALDLSIIDKDVFFEYYRLLQRRWKQIKDKRESGGSFDNSFPVSNGRHFTEAVMRAVYSGALLMRDGADFLGVRPATLDKKAREFGIA